MQRERNEASQRINQLGAEEGKVLWPVAGERRERGRRRVAT
jgi:hypothetical protein